MELSQLQELGLTPTEAKIYVSLLERGSSLASIISKHSKTERAVTYHILEKLQRKGLVSYVIKENRKYFQAADPSELKRLVQEKESLADSLIPLLKSIRNKEEEPLSVEVFQGAEGFKTIMDDLLNEGKDYFILNYTARSTEIARFWYHHWNKRRVKQGIKRFLLVKTSLTSRPELGYALTKVKSLPKDYPAEASTIIYGKDKVVIFLPLDDFAGIRIRNKKVYDSYRKNFEIIWETRK
ncbi:MAG: helix-turn-helix domain-containing protein [Candidatus Woesearchaeota archaeon]|jgi:sugar-specific transcriptional regulator TrmB